MMYSPNRNQKPVFELNADIVNDYASKDYNTSIALNARRGLARIVAGILHKTEPVASGCVEVANKIEISEKEAEFLLNVWSQSRKLDALDEKTYKGKKDEDPEGELNKEDAKRVIKKLMNKEEDECDPIT